VVRVEAEVDDACRNPRSPRGFPVEQPPVVTVEGEDDAAFVVGTLEDLLVRHPGRIADDDRDIMPGFPQTAHGIEREVFVGEKVHSKREYCWGPTGVG